MTNTRWYRALLGPAALVALIGVAAKGLQGLAGILFAHIFGAGPQADAYWLARVIPIGVYLIFDNLLYNAFVPVFRDDASGKNQRTFLSTVAVLVCLSALVITLVLEVGSGFWANFLGKEVDPTTRVHTLMLFRIMSIAIVLAIPASLLKALNVCHGRYVLASLDGLVMTGFTVGALLLAATGQNIAWVAASLPGACLTLLLIQALFVRKNLSLGRPDIRNPVVREFAILLAPLAVFNVLHQINLIVINGFLAHSGEGAVSWFHYSYNIAQIPVSVIDLVLLSTLFPFASALLAHNDKETFSDAFHAAAGWLVAVLVPAAAWLVLNRTALVQLVFRHGQFDDTAAIGTAGCLVGVGLAAVPWTLEAFGCRCLLALKRHSTYASIVGIRVAANIVLGFALARSFGAYGISVAFALSFCIGAVLALCAVAQTVGDGAFFRRLARPTLLGLAAAAGVAAIHLGIGATGIAGHFTRLAIEAILGAAVIVGVYWPVARHGRRLARKG